MPRIRAHDPLPTLTSWSATVTFGTRLDVCTDDHRSFPSIGKIGPLRPPQTAKNHLSVYRLAGWSDATEVDAAQIPPLRRVYRFRYNTAGFGGFGGWNRWSKDRLGSRRFLRCLSPRLVPRGFRWRWWPYRGCACP